jgi:hypothetical protein
MRRSMASENLAFPAFNLNQSLLPPTLGAPDLWSLPPSHAPLVLLVECMPLWGRPSHGSPGKTGPLALSAGASPRLPLSLRLPAGGPARSPSVPGLPAARAWRATR